MKEMNGEVLMSGMPYVCLYARYLQTLAPFTDAQRGKIVMAMLQYAASGELPQFKGNERFIWPTIQAQIDRDAEVYQQRCSKNRSNGKKGGRPAKNPSVSEITEGFSEEPKKPNTNTNTSTNTNTNTSTNTSTSTNTTTNKKEREFIAAEPPVTLSQFVAPSVEEVKEQCRKMGYRVDPVRFVDYYTANGWKIGSAAMQDWRAALKMWNGKEKNNGNYECIIPENWTIGTVL